MLRQLTIPTLLLSAALSCAAQDSGLPRGVKEIGLSGAAYVTHDSPADVFGFVTGRFGIYAARNHQVGVDATMFAYSRTQDVYLSGFYRYTFARSERRLAPYVGGAIGSNLTHFDYIDTERALILKAQAGIRYFLAAKLSLDIGYDLMFRRHTTYSLTGRTSSLMTFGFSKGF